MCGPDRSDLTRCAAHISPSATVHALVDAVRQRACHRPRFGTCTVRFDNEIHDWSSSTSSELIDLLRDLTVVAIGNVYSLVKRENVGS